MVIAADDVLAPMLNDIDDVERVLPGTIDVMREWLRLYAWDVSRTWRLTRTAP